VWLDGLDIPLAMYLGATFREDAYERRSREVQDDERERAALERPADGRGDRALQCDPVLLRRALDNLLDNAAKYSDVGTPVTLAVEPNGSSLAFEIVDRGIGMSPTELDRAFTPFWRADGSRARKTGGVGLGLALARRIARAHGGDVTLASRPGQGTTARLEVPLT
jgi:signal transduction histidine kinase